MLVLLKRNVRGINITKELTRVEILLIATLSTVDISLLTLCLSPILIITPSAAQKIATSPPRRRPRSVLVVNLLSPPTSVGRMINKKAPTTEIPTPVHTFQFSVSPDFSNSLIINMEKIG